MLVDHLALVRLRRDPARANAFQIVVAVNAENPDLAFVDLTHPHHGMAIAASNTSLKQATLTEIGALLKRVHVDKRRVIDELTDFRAELAGTGTPVA